jgi:prepilin-type N-terminal cleavage/methylation domain-containing protein
MEGRAHISSRGGFSLIELLVVLTVISVCAAACILSVAQGLDLQAARGAAQSWQAGTAWAQVGVLWQADSNQVLCADGRLVVSHGLGLCGGDLGAGLPAARVVTNREQWAKPEGTAVTFGGDLASPDGGGSVYFGRGLSAYRVVVRPESGLTVRSHSEPLR